MGRRPQRAGQLRAPAPGRRGDRHLAQRADPRDDRDDRRGGQPWRDDRCADQLSPLTAGRCRRDRAPDGHPGHHVPARCAVRPAPAAGRTRSAVHRGRAAYPRACARGVRGDRTRGGRPPRGQRGGVLTVSAGAYLAGGLVPTNPISVRDLVVFGGARPEVRHNEKLERDPQIAHRLYELAAPRPEDVFVVASQSGINGSVVEFALLVKERGHHLIAITSAAHTARVTPRHPSGRRLVDIADVVLDNGAPYGDALLPLPGGGSVCAVSSVTNALLAQLVVAEVVRRIEAAGQVPPIYLSANVPGGDEHNHTLESRYAGRIRRTA